MTKKQPAICAGVLSMALFAAACSAPVRQPQTPSASVEVVRLVIIDDSPGNKDGQLNPGETAKIQLQLKNVGKTKIPASKATVFTSESGIRISQKVLDFPALTPGGSALSSNALVVSVDGAVLAPSAALYIEATTGANYRATFPAIINPQTFSVEVVNVIIDDSGNVNKDGRLNPGETVRMRVQLRNTGRDTIPPGQAILSTNQRGVRLLDSLTRYQAIAPGASASPIDDGYQFTLAKNVSDTCIAFAMTGTQNSQPVYEASFCEQSYVNIYACMDTCYISRGRGTIPDTFVVRLSLCNDSGSPLSKVAVNIQGLDIWVCGEYQARTVTFTAITDKVFYDDIELDECAVPAPCSLPEFRYIVTGLGPNAGRRCIWFEGRIYENADCKITLPSDYTKWFEACCEVDIPARPPSNPDEND